MCYKTLTLVKCFLTCSFINCAFGEGASVELDKGKHRQPELSEEQAHAPRKAVRPREGARLSEPPHSHVHQGSLLFLEVSLMTDQHFGKSKQEEQERLREATDTS